jgi:hypothetical protein
MANPQIIVAVLLDNFVGATMAERQKTDKVPSTLNPQP